MRVQVVCDVDLLTVELVKFPFNGEAGSGDADLKTALHHDGTPHFVVLAGAPATFYIASQYHNGAKRPAVLL